MRKIASNTLTIALMGSTGNPKHQQIQIKNNKFEAMNQYICTSIQRAIQGCVIDWKKKGVVIGVVSIGIKNLPPISRG